MTRRRGRRWQNFPAEYFKLTEHFYSHDAEPRTLQLRDACEAIATRLDIYRFFESVRRQSELFTEQGDTQSLEAIWCHNLVEAADTMTLRVEGSQILVRRRPFAAKPRIREYDPEAQERARRLAAGEQVQRLDYRSLFPDELKKE